jgi:hypothetical protein
MSILTIIGILFTGAIVLVFLFRWILMVERILDEQKKSLESVLGVANRLVEFIDKNIKERVVYTAENAYDNTDKLADAMGEGSEPEEEPEEMTMEKVQDVVKIKDEEGEEK